MARLRLWGCKARRPAYFMHSGDLSALGTRYLPWIVSSRSLLQCRSSIRMCRGAATRGCLECSTSHVLLMASPRGRESELYLKAPTLQFHACWGGGCTMVPSPLRSELTNFVGGRFEVPCKVVRLYVLSFLLGVTNTTEL